MGGAKNRCHNKPAQGLKASADGSSSGPQVRSSRACQPSARLAPGPGAFGSELSAVVRPSFPRSSGSGPGDESCQVGGSDASPAGSSSGPPPRPCSCNTAPHVAQRVPGEASIDPPGFCSEFDFWTWASAMPRLVLSSGTSFSRFLKASFCIRDRGPPASDTALFPLPVPSLLLFDEGTPKHGPPGLAYGPRGRHLLLERVLYVSVLALNFLHADFRHVPTEALRKLPTELHLNIFSRLRSMLKACSERGTHPLASGRRGPHLVARLCELNTHLASLGLSTLPYPRSENLSGFVAHSPDGPECLRPYRDADPSRLKISGNGSWDLQEHLGPRAPPGFS